jgi:hypothetical protein
MTSKLPYPGFPPSYKKVNMTGGSNRTCIIIDILSIGRLTDIELAKLQESLEFTLANFKDVCKHVEGIDVVLPDRFDSKVMEGLRI